MPGFFKKKKDRILIAGFSTSTAIILDELERTTLSSETEIILLCPRELREAANMSRFGKTYTLTIIDADCDKPEILAKYRPAECRSVLINGWPASDGGECVLKATRALLAAGDSDTIAAKTLVIVDSDRVRRGIKDTINAKIKCLSVEELYPRIIAQAARQRNLDRVYRELFAFEGNEIYFYPAAKLAGMTYSRSLRAFKNACLIGIKSGTSVRTNPPMNTVIDRTDELIMIARCLSDIEKDGAIVPAPDARELSDTTLEPKGGESFLFAGWDRYCPRVLAELPHYCAPGSKVRVLYDRNGPAPEAEMLKEGSASSSGAHNGLSVTFEPFDLTSPGAYSNIEWEHYENVIIATTPTPNSQEKLLHSLMTSLSVKGFANNITLMSERVEGHVIEHEVSVSLIFSISAQLLLHLELAPVIRQLSTPDHAEIYLKPAENYVKMNTPATFYTIIEAARRKNETAIGYVRADPVHIAINPQKTDIVSLSHFDTIAVIADQP